MRLSRTHCLRGREFCVTFANPSLISALTLSKLTAEIEKSASRASLRSWVEATLFRQLSLRPHHHDRGSGCIHLQLLLSYRTALHRKLFVYASSPRACGSAGAFAAVTHLKSTGTDPAPAEQTPFGGALPELLEGVFFHALRFLGAAASSLCRGSRCRKCVFDCRARARDQPAERARVAGRSRSRSRSRSRLSEDQAEDLDAR